MNGNIKWVSKAELLKMYPKKEITMKPQLKIAGVCFTGIAIVSLIWFFTPTEFWEWVDGWETWENVKLFVGGLIVGGLFVSIAWLLVLMCTINGGRKDQDQIGGMR